MLRETVSQYKVIANISAVRLLDVLLAGNNFPLLIKYSIYSIILFLLILTHESVLFK